MIIKVFIRKYLKNAKEKFDGIIELTYKIDHNDLIYNFKNDTVKKIL